MTTKLPGLIAGDGSYYVTLSDGQGNAAAGGGMGSKVTAGPFSQTSATNLFSIDTSGYGTIAVQVTSPGTTCTITYEASDDNTNWITVNGFAPNAAASTNVTGTSTTATTIWFPLFSRYFRARISTYTSGTVTVVYTLSALDMPRQATTVGGVYTDGSGVGTSALATVFEGRTSAKNGVANGTHVRPIATSIGQTVNKPYQVPELDLVSATATGGIVNSATAVQVFAAGAAGVRNFMTALQLSTDTLGAATEIVVLDGAAVLWRGKLQTGPLGITNIEFPTPLKGTAATAMNIQTVTAVTGGVYWSAQGYTAI